MNLVGVIEILSKLVYRYFPIDIILSTPTIALTEFLGQEGLRVRWSGLSSKSKSYALPNISALLFH